MSPGLTLGPGLRYNRSPIEPEGRGAIPFTGHARANGDSDLQQTQRRRRDGRDAERPTPPRRARRRRQSTPWLQRNALSVAAVSILMAFLGLGFGLLQMLNRAEPTPALLALGGQIDAPTIVTGTSASLLSGAGTGPVQQVVAAVSSVPAPADAVRSIHSDVKILQPNYTIAGGDTLVQIALRFNTTVDRIQAFNNLADPRTLRIGTKLVIPPPL